jgi:ankyrin repeat protein
LGEKIDPFFTQRMKSIKYKMKPSNLYNTINLHNASCHGQYDKCLKLLSSNHGVDVNDRVHNGKTSLCAASENGHLDVVKLLIEHGVDLDKATYGTKVSPLFIASEKKRTEIVQVLLENGAMVDNLRDDWSSPLHIASEKGHAQIVEMLLRFDAKPNYARFTDGVTPLFMASEMGHTEIISMLIRAGAIADIIRPRDGASPLLMASQNGHDDAVKELIRHSATVDITKHGNKITPLYIASELGHVKVVNTLIEHGANVNAMNVLNKRTALFVAAQRGHYEVVETLLKHGAIADCKDFGTQTPLSIAVANHKHDIADLLQYFVKPTAKQSLCMVMAMLQELVVYHHLDCLSIIELFEMMQ